MTMWTMTKRGPGNTCAKEEIWVGFSVLSLSHLFFVQDIQKSSPAETFFVLVQ